MNRTASTYTSILQILATGPSVVVSAGLAPPISGLNSPILSDGTPYPTRRSGPPGSINKNP